MTVNALHNMVQDNYDRDELSSFFELTLYHTISWWIDVANDIPLDDVLKGLTYKAFGMDYNSTKEHLFEYLRELTEQIKYMIF